MINRDGLVYSLHNWLASWTGLGFQFPLFCCQTRRITDIKMFFARNSIVWLTTFRKCSKSSTILRKEICDHFCPIPPTPSNDLHPIPSSSKVYVLFFFRHECSELGVVGWVRTNPKVVCICKSVRIIGRSLTNMRWAHVLEGTSSIYLLLLLLCTYKYSSCKVYYYIMGVESLSPWTHGQPSLFVTQPIWNQTSFWPQWLNW